MKKPWLVLLVALSAGAQTLEFVQISDTHLMRPREDGPALAALKAGAESAAARLGGYLESLKSNPPAFVLHTGDCVEAYRIGLAGESEPESQIGYFASVMGKSPVPVYLTLGNRDMFAFRYSEAGKAAARQTVAAEAREAWRRAFAVFGERTYYAFTRTVGPARYRFVMLDNAVWSDAGFVAEQLAWLRSELRGEGVDAFVVAMHMPPPLSKGLSEALALAPKPMLVLAGHTHRDGVADLSTERAEAWFFTTQGYTSGGGKARRVVLGQDGMDVYVTGEPQRLERSIRLVRR